MNDLQNIINFLHINRGLDFSGYRTAMLNRRVRKRILTTNLANLDEYKNYLEHNNSELDMLIDVLTINVSRFFRDTFSFEYIASTILPKLIIEKNNSKDRSVRIWSAGCASGEEPYSIAILIKEIFKNEKLKLNTAIFATDINKKVLEFANEGVYSSESIKNIRHSLLDKYFLTIGKVFKLRSSIKKMVQFSEFDMINQKSIVPPESIYGDFDIVLCRNLLIYFESDFQEVIFNKLYQSLNINGVLFLGDAEIPLGKYKNKFTKISKYHKIYRKIGAF
jgi:chemotaxis methyl-accepting protein methylase